MSDTDLPQLGRKHLLQGLVGIAVAGLLLAWCIHRADSTELLRELSKLTLPVLIPALLCEAIVQISKALKWQAILSRVQPVRYSSALSAVIVGAASTHLVPLRLDEVLRSAVLARREGIAPGTVLGTVAVDRIIELFVAGLILTGALLFFDDMPSTLTSEGPPLWWAAVILGFALLIAAMGVVVLLRSEKQFQTWLLGAPFPGAAWLGRGIQSIARGLRAMPRGRSLGLVILGTIGEWGATIAFYGWMLKSFSITDAPDSVPLLMSIGNSIAYMVPNVPGALGVYEAVQSGILETLAGSERETAMAVALAAHAVLAIPVTLAGLVVGLFEFRRPGHLLPPRLIAALGFLAGVALWLFAWTSMAPAGSMTDTLSQAQELGITSTTLREGYDKSQELKAWLLGSLLVPGSLLLGWLLATRRRPGARSPSASGATATVAARATANTARSDLLGKKLPWLVVALAALGVALRPGVLHGANPWGSFGLLGEEGVYLGAVQALRSGRVLYADLHFPYGPLLIKPLQLWLAVFGDTVVAARAYVLLLHGLGVAGLALTVRLVLGRSYLAHWSAAGGAVAVALLAPTEFPNLNSVLIRTVLAFLPVATLLAGLRWWRTLARDHAARITPFHLAGSLVAISALVSVEVGAASAAGVFLALLLARLGRGPWLQTATGLLLVLTVALAPLAIEGGLGPFLEQTMGAVKVSSLGYQALPYPDPLGLFVAANGTTGTYPREAIDSATAMWCVLPPLLIWLALGVGAAGMAWRSPRKPGLPLLCIAVTAALMFLASLGRSDLYHLWFYGAVPVVLIASILGSRAWLLLNGSFRWLVPAVALPALLMMLALEPLDEVRFPQQGAVATELRLPRTGKLVVATETAAHLEAVLSWAQRLPAEEQVYFYPSEAMFYFLTNRPPPVSFLWAYDAPTRAMQERAIAELNTTRPRWLLESKLTFPIDWIPEAELLPQLELYIQSNYETVGMLPGATLMRRIQR